MSNQQSTTFRGPLLLLGMPRSGTKLLRDLLNRHPQLRFSVLETDFFPYWVLNWAHFGPDEQGRGFEEFFRKCRSLPFLVQNADRGLAVDCEQWYRACDSFTPAGVFEALMRLVLRINENEESVIWGDKSPSYTAHLPLLMREFPQAKVVHIVRDPRDCALSARKAWGKSILRSAQRWQDDVSKCRADGKRFPGAYLELRYEDLLLDTRNTLRRVCEFVGVDFLESMLTSERDVGKVGATSVSADNVGKYRTRMPDKLISQVERITCTTLRDMEYQCDYTGPEVRLPRWRLHLLKAHDGFGVIRAGIKRHGLLGAFRFHWEYFRISGNRMR